MRVLSDFGHEDAEVGLDLLRSLAGYPQRSVHVGKHSIQSRIVVIDRDANGDVIRSTERLELTIHTGLDGEWLG